MPLFHYTAIDGNGTKVKGEIDAPTESVAVGLLRERGLIVSEISIGRESTSLFASILSPRVSAKEKVAFTKQLATLLKSGVPLLESLDLLSGQFEGKMHSVIVSLKDGVSSGSSLSSEMERFPSVFSKVHVQLIRAGEESGNLGTMLERLSVYIARTEDFKKKIRDALTGPILKTLFAFLVFLGVSKFTLPNIIQAVRDMGGNVPFFTTASVAFANFFTDHFLLLLVATVAFIFLFKRWTSTESGGLTFDRFLLSVPLISKISRYKAVTQFCSTLGMLLESGVPLPRAMKIVSEIVSNKVLLNKLLEARENIIREGKISKFLDETGIFPPIASHMIKTGEESGNLASMLSSVGDEYEKELSDALDRLASVISPIAMILMLFVVLIVVMSVLMPTFSIIQAVGAEGT